MCSIVCSIYYSLYLSTSDEEENKTCLAATNKIKMNLFCVIMCFTHLHYAIMLSWTGPIYSRRVKFAGPKLTFEYKCFGTYFVPYLRNVLCGNFVLSIQEE